MDAINRNTLSYDIVVDAPQSIAFRTWTHGELLSKWWAPKSDGETHAEIDARKGGKVFINMRDAGGKDFPVEGFVLEIQEPAVFSFVCLAFADKKGGYNLETRISVLLEALGADTTRVSVTVELQKADPSINESIEKMDEGWIAALQRFKETASGASIA